MSTILREETESESEHEYDEYEKASSKSSEIDCYSPKSLSDDTRSRSDVGSLAISPVSLAVSGRDSTNELAATPIPILRSQTEPKARMVSTSYQPSSSASVQQKRSSFLKSPTKSSATTMTSTASVTSKPLGQFISRDMDPDSMPLPTSSGRTHHGLSYQKFFRFDMSQSRDTDAEDSEQNGEWKKTVFHIMGRARHFPRRSHDSGKSKSSSKKDATDRSLSPAGILYHVNPSMELQSASSEHLGHHESKYRVRIYPWTGANDYIILCDTDFISVGGGDGVYGLWIDKQFERCISQPCPTFHNEVLSSRPGEFEPVRLEVWACNP